MLGWRIFWTRYLERTGIHIRRAAAAAEDDEAKAGTYSSQSNKVCIIFSVPNAKAKQNLIFIQMNMSQQKAFASKPEGL